MRSLNTIRKKKYKGELKTNKIRSWLSLTNAESFFRCRESEREIEATTKRAREEKKHTQHRTVKISQNEKFFVFFLHFNTQQRKTHSRCDRTGALYKIIRNLQERLSKKNSVNSL